MALRFPFPFFLFLLFREASPVAASDHSTHPSGRLVADGGVVVRRGGDRRGLSFHGVPGWSAFNEG